MTELFKLFDQDGNGRIDSNELKVVMTSVTNVKVTNGEVDAMIKEADANGDGVLDPAEFIRIMKKHK